MRLLAGIERAAAAQFPLDDVPEHLRNRTVPDDVLDAARRDGMLWVALDQQREPVAFLVLHLLDGIPFILEMDVHPDHARQGIGASLIRAVTAWVQEWGYSTITLTTFRHLPWNAPYYARLGFEKIPGGALSPGLAAQLDSEAAAGLDPANRVAMALPIKPPA